MYDLVFIIGFLSISFYEYSHLNAGVSNNCCLALLITAALFAAVAAMVMLEDIVMPFEQVFPGTRWSSAHVPRQDSKEFL